MLPRYCIISGSAYTHLVTQFMIWKYLKRLKFLFKYIYWMFSLTWLNISVPASFISMDGIHKLTLWVFILLVFPGHVSIPWHDWALRKIQQNDHFLLKLASHEKWLSYSFMPSQSPGYQSSNVINPCLLLLKGHPNQWVFSLLEAWEKVLSTSWSCAARKEIFRLFDVAE